MKKTIAELLKELKVLDARITTGISTTIGVSVKVGNRLPTGFQSQEELHKAITGSMASVEDLIKYRAKIKSAIVKSNAEAEVEVAGVKMTVAEAIERKTSIGYLRSYANFLEKQYTSVKTAIDKGNAEVKQRLDQMLLASRGKDGKVDPASDEAFSKNFTENNEYKLVDPAKIREKIDSLNKSIADFDADVDVRLSISNAITEVEV